MTTMFSEDEARKVGERFVDMLGLTKNKAGRYTTTWGDKTLEGLGRCVQRIVEEARTPETIKE